MGIVDGRAMWAEESFGAELIDITIGDLLDRQAEAFPDNEAIVYHEPAIGVVVRWRYPEYRERANALARGLIALGVEAGDRVAVLAPNLPEWILLEMALAKVGAVLVTVNTAYRKAELEYLLRQGEVAHLFLVDAFRGNSYLDSLLDIAPEIEAVGDPAAERIAAAALPNLEHVVLLNGPRRPGTLLLEDVVALGARIPDEERRRRQAAVRPHDISQIQYTSGTTGAPKGVMLTHHGTVNNARLIGLRGGFTSADRLISGMPLFHTAGCVCNVLTMLALGGTLVAMVAFDAGTALRLIGQERCTIHNAVPTMFQRLLEHEDFRAGRADVSSLRIAWTGGTSIPAVLMEEVKARMGAEPVVIMGMTETSPIITMSRPSDPFAKRIATAGVPLPFTQIRIVDPETGALKACGEPGELQIRGYLTMKGYYKMPERTAETIDAEGWLRSGDLATLDGEGYLAIVGRIKDMIIRGGENLYPAEIETFLMRHPLILDAQVVGVPDKDYGEEAFAFLRVEPGATLTEEEVRAYCRANISRHKMPRYIAFVDDYPMTASGKIRKVELREAARQRLGQVPHPAATGGAA